jgi:L-amino acid N-acyltransferase YncA
VRIVEKGILDMTGRELRQCRSLSLRAGGLMSEDLTDWKFYERKVAKLRRKVRIWMIKNADDTLIAWAIITPAGAGRPGYDAQFYTRKSERGKGYGSLLMQKVLEVTPNPNVFPHSKLSGDFFKKHRNSIRFDKYDEKWLT